MTINKRTVKAALVIGTFLIGQLVALTLWLAQPAHADPIQCDPFTPLYDYKWCYALQPFEPHQSYRGQAPESPNPPYYRH